VKNVFNSFEGMRNMTDFNVYVVKKGDSLYKIAMAYNTTVDVLKNANNLASEMIYPNQILFIPKRGSGNHQSSNIYQTIEGDTLRTLFEKLRLDWKCLKKYEPILDVLIEPNQVIELVSKYDHSNKMITYMGEDLEEFLMNNEIDAVNLLKLNQKNWLMPGAQVRIL
jgi:LysM repeat protein